MPCPSDTGMVQLNVRLSPHREGCLCVICKQMRRAGRPAEPIGAPSYAPVFASQPKPPAKPAGHRVGKRAYISATPHLVGGGSASLQVATDQSSVGLQAYVSADVASS